MSARSNVPGVYREDVFLKAQVQLPTGVPGFVGFATPKDKSGVSFNNPLALHRQDEFDAKIESVPESFLADAVAGFFLNGGSRCYLAVAEPGADREAALINALASLAPVTDLDLIAVPDAMTLRRADDKTDKDAIVRLQTEMLQHAETYGGRLAILDSLPARVEDINASVEDIKGQRARLLSGMTEPVNGALYFPWISIANKRLIPPSGHIAGIFARSDARAGVFKAPANEEILGVLDLEVVVNNQIQDQLNPEGVNCLRAFRGRGIRVWGARTISRDPNWRYVNVRRIFLTLQRWIDANMTWANFETNTPRLWVRVNREMGVYLESLWRAGGLTGQTAEQAFYIKCDAETNPPEVREAGRVVVEVGLAPTLPGEFIVVRIIHHTGVEPR
jgi:Phage tail sheath protein FI